MLLLLLFALGEIFSLISMLYIKYFGTPEELFTYYNEWSTDIALFFTAFCGGWILFPFFIYCLYKQIQMNNNQIKEKEL